MIDSILEIVKDAYKEGYSDATDILKNIDHWWESSISKSRLEYEIKKLKDTK